MIDTNTTTPRFSHSHTHTHVHADIHSSLDAHAYACLPWFMHPGGGVSLSESKASTQVSSFVNQLPIYGCVFVRSGVDLCTCVDVCAYKSRTLCVRVEVSFGNGLIIAAEPSFIIFIEFFPASALWTCKSYRFSTVELTSFHCVWVGLHF